MANIDAPFGLRPIAKLGSAPGGTTGRKPNGASIFAILVSYLNSETLNLTIRLFAPKSYSALPILMDWHAWVLFLM